MGCLFRMGCLLILALLAVVGWFTRDKWLPLLDRDRGSVTANVWEPLSEDGAARTRQALARLESPSGPVFETLSGSDAASYVVQQLSKQLPSGTDSMEAGVFGDQVRMRAVVPTSAVGGSAALGAIGGLLGDRERVELGGNFQVVRPGMGQFRIAEMRVRGFPMPQGMIPRMVARIGQGSRPTGVAREAIPVPLPQYIGDIRVADGRITLYKTTTDR